MAVRDFPGLDLTGGYAPGQSGWSDAMNNNLRLLSGVVQLAVLDRVAALPGSPTDGDIYLLTATGDVNKIAVRDAGAWVLFTPNEGWLCYVADEDVLYAFNGTAWVLFSSLLTASAIPNTPAGNIAATTVQGAINELDTEKVAKAGDTMTGSLNIQIGSGLGSSVGGDGIFVTSSTGGVTYFTMSTGGSFITVRVGTTAAQTATWRLTKSRGTVTAPTAPLQNDFLGACNFDFITAGGVPLAFQTSARFRAQVICATPSATDSEGRVLLEAAPAGSTAPTEIGRWDNATGYSMYGANPVIDNNRLFRLRVYTVATLPAAGTRGRLACVSDATAPAYLAALVGGGAVSCSVFDNGAAWVSN